MIVAMVLHQVHHTYIIYDNNVRHATKAVAAANAAPASVILTMIQLIDAHDEYHNLAPPFHR
jgi:hypothetical protein